MHLLVEKVSKPSVLDFHSSIFVSLVSFAAAANTVRATPTHISSAAAASRSSAAAAAAAPLSSSSSPLDRTAAFTLWVILSAYAFSQSVEESSELSKQLQVVFGIAPKRFRSLLPVYKAASKLAYFGASSSKLARSGRLWDSLSWLSGIRTSSSSGRVSDCFSDFDSESNCPSGSTDSTGNTTNTTNNL